MESMRNFLRDHGMVCVLVLCGCAAVATGAWAVNTIRRETVPTPPAAQPDRQEQTLPRQPEPQLTWEDNEWNTGFNVAGRVEHVPENRSGKGSQPGSGSSSGASSAGKPGSDSGKADASADAAAALYGPPVSGSEVQPFSGDELVYNETLADWRTHNGVDYACAIGAAVQAPAAGTVTRVEDGGNWGGVLELTEASGRIWRLCGVAADCKTGDAVTCGQPVGRAAGIACEAAVGTHIHLEVEQDGVYQDPAQLFG